MVGTISCPSGASGKQPLTPSSNVTLPPMPPLPNRPVAPSQIASNLALIKTLADTITLSNVRVKKLNFHRSQCRLDTSSNLPVSDDEEETPILDLGTVMAIPVAPAQNPTIPDVQCIQVLATTPEATGSNSITIDSRPSNWQSSFSGIPDQAHAPDQSPAKPAVIDYQSLSPIYSADDVTKNK